MIHLAVKLLGRFDMQSQVDLDTTHIIYGEPRRTMSLMLGMSQGCWVVSLGISHSAPNSLLFVAWVLSSIEQEKWVDECPFEMKEPFPAAIQIRQNPDILKTMLIDSTPIFISPSQNVASEIKKLVVRMGGTLVSHIKGSVCIGKPPKGVDKPKVAVAAQWLFDSLTQLTIKNYDDYRI